jgi:hypothetical protein
VAVAAHSCCDRRKQGTEQLTMFVCACCRPAASFKLGGLVGIVGKRDDELCGAMMYWTGIMPLGLFFILLPVIDFCILSAVRILTVFMMHKT